ncbi:MAG: ATP-binding cassette domain-containing protein [Deltaproteobacteria bacterium]|nr:ATP-binding cassette domain-containing protein [Deltaproteobacteria bacterium]
MTHPSLTAHAVTLRVGTATLLDAVSLAARPGEVLALIGPNGAGKSTLLGALAGSRIPTSGVVTLDDLPLTPSRGPAWDPLELARRRAVLPQLETLAFPLSALEVVLLGRHPHRTRRRHDIDLAWDALGRVDARHLATRAFPTLSGGERQRIRIARALVQIARGEAEVAPASIAHGQPELARPSDSATPTRSRWLLLDEPSSGLDLAQARALHALLRDEAKRGTGIIIVEHDLALAAQADRVAVLARGRLVALGPPQATLTRALLAEVFALDAALVTLPSGGLALDLGPLPQAAHADASFTSRSPSP